MDSETFSKSSALSWDTQDFLQQEEEKDRKEKTESAKQPVKLPLSHAKQAYVVPWARKLYDKEKSEVDHYRNLRERFHNGPFYSVLDSASSSAKKGTAARANFDPFHGMPSYSGKYQKKHRTMPKIDAENGPHEFGTYAWKYIGS